MATMTANRFDKASTAAEVLAGIDLTGKLALVTGGATGIGLITAQALANAGADVVIGGRTPQKLAAAGATLRAENPGRAIHAWPLDQLSFESVDAFADRMIALDRPLDIQVNNAGIIGPLRRNAEGLESGLMTNFIAHALLTSRLRHVLAASGSARIASLSSFGHHYSSVVLDDLNFEHRPYDPWSSYGQSKTACCLLAVKASRDLGAAGVDAFAVHPGAIDTGFSRDMTQDDFDAAVRFNFVPGEADWKTSEQGAATTAWAVSAPELAGMGGCYLEDCRVATITDDPRTTAGVMAYALDPSLADQLWAATERLIGRELPLRA